MRNGMETEDGNERIQIRAQQGPFTWFEMIIMTVLVTISIMMG
jgi:hypothetical protein